MVVAFQTIPDNIRTPLFWVEVDASQAGRAVYPQPTLLIGQQLDSGTLTNDQPQLIARDQIASMAGRGSMLARMATVYAAGDRGGELWVLPIADDGAAAAATGSIDFGGPASGAGTLNLYIAGQRLRVGVAAGDSADDIATAVAAAITAETSLPVTAAVNGVTTSQVDFTAKNKGALGNEIDLRVNYLGSAGGESLPAGVTATVTAMAGGSGDPDITTALANVGDEPFDFFVLPYTDTPNLDAFKDFMGDVSGRWSYVQQRYGGGFSAKRGTLGELATFGNARNDPHVSVMGYGEAVDPPWVWAVAYAAAAARSLRADPALPIQTLPLIGVKAPVARFDQQERNTLLYDGIATHRVADDGSVLIDREITTYQQNAFGDPDTAWLDIQTPYTLQTVLRRLSGVVTNQMSRKKLANNGEPIDTSTVTPAIIRSLLIAEYRVMQRDGLVENVEAFAENLVVERDEQNPNRVNVLYPPDLINQLRIFAVLAQFRLQYPQAA